MRTKAKDVLTNPALSSVSQHDVPVAISPGTSPFCLAFSLYVSECACRIPTTSLSPPFFFIYTRPQRNFSLREPTTTWPLYTFSVFAEIQNYFDLKYLLQYKNNKKKPFPKQAYTVVFLSRCLLTVYPFFSPDTLLPHHLDRARERERESAR